MYYMYSVSAGSRHCMYMHVHGGGLGNFFWRRGGENKGVKKISYRVENKSVKFGSGG